MYIDSPDISGDISWISRVCSTGIKGKAISIDDIRPIGGKFS